MNLRNFSLQDYILQKKPLCSRWNFSLFKKKIKIKNFTKNIVLFENKRRNDYFVGEQFVTNQWKKINNKRLFHTKISFYTYL